MENKILIVVDMQNDFITGSLGTKEAQAIVPNVIKKIEEYNQNLNGYIFYTQDTHNSDYLNTQEGKKLPVLHCIKPTEGWCIHPKIAQELSVKGKGVEKDAFGALNLTHGFVGQELFCYGYGGQREDAEYIELIGVCTDICVVSNALLLKAKFPEIPIKVDPSCCAGSTPEMHEMALRVMQSCQIEITK